MGGKKTTDCVTTRLNSHTHTASLRSSAKHCHPRITDSRAKSQGLPKRTPRTGNSSKSASLVNRLPDFEPKLYVTKAQCCQPRHCAAPPDALCVAVKNERCPGSLHWEVVNAAASLLCQHRKARFLRCVSRETAVLWSSRDLSNSLTTRVWVNASWINE